MPEYARTIFMSVMVILIVAMVIMFLMKLFQFALVAAALIFIVPILVTVTWGDGSEYVSKFASIFTPNIEQTINDGYQYYREENEKNPVVDVEQLEKYAEDAKEYLADKAEDFAEDAGETIEGYLQNNGYIPGTGPSLDDEMKNSDNSE